MKNRSSNYVTGETPSVSGMSPFITIKEAAEISGHTKKEIRDLCWAKAIRHIRSLTRQNRPAVVLREDAIAIKDKEVVYAKNFAGCLMAEIKKQ